MAALLGECATQRQQDQQVLLSRIADVEKRITSKLSYTQKDIPEYHKDMSERDDAGALLSERDLLCKWIALDQETGMFLVLPVTTDDPVVAAYLRGQPTNAYMLDFLRLVTDIGDQVVDLGAHVGTFAIGAAVSGRRVIAVDANRQHIALLDRSIKINGLDNVVLCHGAIAAGEGVVRFREDGLFGAVDYSGNSSGTIPVPAKRLDDVIENLGRGRVRLLKMDIEGSEFDAILTGERLFAQDRPMVWFESNGPTLRNAGNSIEELRSLFERYGYRCFRQEGERWIYAPPEQIQPEAWVDMFAMCEPDWSRWSARIDWSWSPNLILEKSRQWAALPHEHTRDHLLAQIEAHGLDVEVQDGLEQIRQTMVTTGRSAA